MTSNCQRTLIGVFLLILSLSGSAQENTQLQPVSIEYIVRLDHEKLGNATLGLTETTLNRTENLYSVFTITKAQGLAAIIIGSNEQQSCEFSINEGRVVPKSYSGGREDSNDYVVEFDWDERKILFSSGDSLDMPQGYIVDSCNMPFAAALLRDKNFNDEVMYVVDGRNKRIRGYKLSSLTTEVIDSTLGETEALKIVLEREFNPDRTFTFWLDSKSGNVPLKMEEKRPSRTTTMIVNKIDS